MFNLWTKNFRAFVKAPKCNIAMNTCVSFSFVAYYNETKFSHHVNPL